MVKCAVSLLFGIGWVVGVIDKLRWTFKKLSLGFYILAQFWPDSLKSKKRNLKILAYHASRHHLISYSTRVIVHGLPIELLDYLSALRDQYFWSCLTNCQLKITHKWPLLFVDPYRKPRRTELVRPSFEATFAAESLAESIQVFRLFIIFSSGT